MFKITVTPRFGDIDGLRQLTTLFLQYGLRREGTPIFRMFTPDLDLSYEKWKLILVRTEFVSLTDVLRERR